MRLKTLVLLLLVTALLAPSGPAHAQSQNPNNPAVTDLGSNIYMVDGRKGPIPNLLPGEEVQKIAALQQAPIGLIELSPVSPDDQTVLVVSTRGFFLNIHSGSTVPLQRITSIKGGIRIISNFFWVGDDRVGLYALDLDSERIVLIAFDRNTGAGEVIQASKDLTKIPLFASANGRKVLIASIPEQATDDPDEALVTRLPGAGDRIRESRHQALVRAGISQEPPAGSRARALAGLADLFDPRGAGVTALAIEPDLLVLDTETGETRGLATLEAGSTLMSLSFSQDASRFALTIDGVNIDPSRGRDGALFSDQIYRDVTGNLPPDQNPWRKRNRLITLDFPSGEVRTLQGADAGGMYAGAHWSTDNQTLVVKVQAPARLAGRRYPIYSPQFRSSAHLRFLNSAFQEIRRVERIEISHLWQDASFISPDEVIIQSQYQLNFQPYYYNWRSGEFRNIADRPGRFLPVVATRQTREIVFAYSSFTDPVDIYRMSWEGRAFSRLTWATEAVRQLSQTRQYPVSFTLRNRTTHSGVLILPASAPFPPRQLPIVVWQEGGPTSEVSNSWAAVVEAPFGLLPSFGFGVLVVPLYGRYGLGPSRFNALADGTNFGQIDIDAQAEIAAQLRARGWASKVGITGCSYGGYFTTQSIVRHPTTYDAAHTMCSLVDLFTEWSRGFSSLAPWMAGLPPNAAPEEYRRDSPFYNAGRIRTPLLAFHGTDDFLPVTIMENFMLQVINNRMPAKMLKFRDAEHSFFNRTPPSLTPVYELYGAQEQIIWFRTYLAKR